METRFLLDAFGAFPTSMVAAAAPIEGRLVWLTSSFTRSLSTLHCRCSLSRSIRPHGPSCAEPRTSGAPVLLRTTADCAARSPAVCERFICIVFDITDRGAVMLDEGLGHDNYMARKELEAGDHVIVLVQLHTAVGHGGGQPLILDGREFARLGSPPPKQGDSNR